MIEAHVIDSWTRRAPTATRARSRSALILGGFGAPLFLFLAGVSVVAVSRLQGAPDAATPGRGARRRAARARDLPARVPFRVQALILGCRAAVDAAQGRHPEHHGAVDRGGGGAVGPGCTAARHGSPRSSWPRWRWRCDADSSEAGPLLALLPDPLEGYLRPIAGLTNFAFFPWAGFVFAGAAAVGVLLDAARTARGRSAA